MRAWDSLKRRRVYRAQIEIRHTILFSPLSGDCEHARRDVDPEDGSARPHAPRCRYCRLTASSCQIEDTHPRANTSEVEHSLAQRCGQARLDAVVSLPDLLGAQYGTLGRHAVMLSQRDWRGDYGPVLMSVARASFTPQWA